MHSIADGQDCRRGRDGRAAVSLSLTQAGPISVDRRSRGFRSLCAGFEPARAGTKETAMRIRTALSLAILPAVLLPGLTAHAMGDGSQTVAAEAAVGVAPATAPSSSAARADQADPAAAVAPPATATSAATGAATAQAGGFGVAMTPDQLDEHRGGDALIGQNYLTGAVTDNVANRVSTGSNSIADGSFANASGLPTVIQNTGANVLIQNATVLNVRFGN
ncbi:hypothetical protein [Burkholderia diffusa]|uniref:hypothetical protein n=1 Tax=Burkholderia diffusa TaxID=488732 RepID=UPI001FD4AC40|nr:hypothetical protein [Burkholderia diffusa]